MEKNKSLDWGQSKDCQGEYNSGCFGEEKILTDPSGVFVCYWKPNNNNSSTTINDKNVNILGSIKFYYWDYDNTFSEYPNNSPLSSNPDPSLWDDNMISEVEYWKEDSEVEDFEKCLNNYSNCKFNNMRMIFNTTVCGEWAGNVFDEDNPGPTSMEQCLSYINSEDNKQLITNQKWQISHIAAFSSELN